MTGKNLLLKGITTASRFQPTRCSSFFTFKPSQADSSLGMMHSTWFHILINDLNIFRGNNKVKYVPIY